MRCCFPVLHTSKANGPDGISAKMLKGTALSTILAVVQYVYKNYIS